VIDDQQKVGYFCFF